MKIKQTPRSIYFVLILVLLVFSVLGFVFVQKVYFLDDTETASAAPTPAEVTTSDISCDLDVAFVIDVSESMRNTVSGRRKIEWAREAVNSFLDRMSNYSTNPENRIRVGLTQVGMRGLSDANIEQPLTSNFSLIRSSLNRLDWVGPDGGTCILCGLNLANNQIINNSPSDVSRAEILLSDGCGNRDYNDWIGIPVSRALTTDEANYGRTHDITYYTIGYNTAGIEGDECGPDQYDEATLVEIAGSSDRHYFRPDVNDWISTFEALATQLCETPIENSCSVSSSVSSTDADPVIIQPGTSLNVGTNFSRISPAGKQAEVRYRAVTSGVINVTPSTNFTVPSPSGSTALSYYYTNVNLEPSASISGGSTEVRAEVFIDGTLQCSASTFVEVGTAPAWWQIGGGDIVAARGNILSDVPVLPSPGKTLMWRNYAGIPIFDGTLNPNVRANIGVPGWSADSRFVSYTTPTGSNYNYNYFASKFISGQNISQSTILNAGYFDTNAGITKDGYQVYLRNGDLNLNTLNFVNNLGKKIVIFVTGEVNINGKILLDDGRDFFMIVSRGNINVDNSVGDTALVNPGLSSTADVEGIFVTDQHFNTNTGASSLRQLVVRGTVVGWGNSGSTNGINFQRDLGTGNSAYPAEIFDYASDLILNFPPFYSEKNITWKEVSP